ncbi:MAG: hypothetical protein H0W44_08925 [Gammaproteobacteria bacterium]|nr:hypothetical protein [Gammaproteobacteria bacterium]
MSLTRALCILTLLSFLTACGESTDDNKAADNAVAPANTDPSIAQHDPWGAPAVAPEQAEGQAAVDAFADKAPKGSLVDKATATASEQDVGMVKEIIPTSDGGITYVQLHTKGGPVWIAAQNPAVKIGDKAKFDASSAVFVESFTSSRLDGREFKNLYMVKTLDKIK